MDSPIAQAVQFLSTLSAKPPMPDAVVEALLQAEKTAKQTKVYHSYSQLLGTWRLGFITGTKRSRQRAGVILGSGRFLPRWVKVHLSYSSTANPLESQPEPSLERGIVQNSVEIGPLQIALTGPTQFWSKKNILAFDFTRMKISLSGLKLYEGDIRGGKDRETCFSEPSLKKQAFFAYFLVQERCLAARGRGGGLALWTKVRDS